MNCKAFLLAMIASAASIPPAQAGFLDFLFGRREPAAAAPAQPLDEISVERAKKPAVRRAPKLVYVSPAQMLASTIDPAATPDWYLIDPTLKKGDVMVLPDRVLVFAGGKIGAEENYVPLDKTRLLDRKTRGQIALMTGRSYAPPMLTANVAPKRLRMLGAN